MRGGESEIEGGGGENETGEEGLVGEVCPRMYLASSYPYPSISPGDLTRGGPSWCDIFSGFVLHEGGGKSGTDSNCCRRYFLTRGPNRVSSSSVSDSEMSVGGDAGLSVLNSRCCYITTQSGLIIRG